MVGGGGYVCEYACVCECVRTRMCVCVCVCVPVCVHIYIYMNACAYNILVQAYSLSLLNSSERDLQLINLKSHHPNAI